MRSPIHGAGDEVASVSSLLTDMELAAAVLLVGWVLDEMKAVMRLAEPLPPMPRS
jgi:hypothetical protein